MLLNIRRDGGIDDTYMIADSQQRRETARMPRGAVASWLENAERIVCSRCYLPQSGNWVRVVCDLRENVLELSLEIV
jgi:hypothetical protein